MCIKGTTVRLFLTHKVAKLCCRLYTDLITSATLSAPIWNEWHLMNCQTPYCFIIKDYDKSVIEMA